MPRKLKFHEAKLLRKVNLAKFPNEDNIYETRAIRKCFLPNRETFRKYQKLVYSIRYLANKLKKLDTKDPFRVKMTEQLLEKMYNMGLIETKQSLSQCDNLGPEAFCRRRLPVLLVRLKYAQSVKEAVTYVEQGHVRVGPDTVTDPAFLVTRNFEDFITWVDRSKIRKHVLAYNELLDDYDML